MNQLTAQEAWQELLGKDYVLTDETIRQDAEQATFLSHQKILGILRPGNCQEVQECLKIADQSNTALYPISKGKNWGYGSRVLVKDGCVLLNIKAANRKSSSQ